MSTSYYENGVRKSIDNHKKNIVVGDQYRFFPNGKPYFIKNYTDVPSPGNIAEVLITANFDSLGTTLVTNGSGYYKGYDGAFKKIIEEGPVKNGRRDGEWKFSDSLVTAVENYVDGKFISGTATFKDGITTNYRIRESVPEFPGGNAEFIKYLSANIRYPAYERKNNITGMVIAQFVVDKDGKISNIRLVRGVSQSINEEAIGVIAKSPAWKPGVRYGRPVNAMYTVPISFKLN